MKIKFDIPEVNDCYQNLQNDVYYTARRFFVDKFHFENIKMLNKGALILDMGGVRLKKQGGLI